MCISIDLTSGNDGNDCHVYKLTMSDKVTHEDKQWGPSISEIGMIFQQLDLSQLHSDNKSDDMMLACELKSNRAAAIIIDELDREELLNKLLTAKKEEIMNEMKNNWFHENLVKHFTKKQMIHVCCNDELGNDTILNEYVMKLFYFDNMKRRSELNNEKWEKALSELRMEICEEREKVNVTLERMISRGKTIESCAWNYGQLFSDKSVQELISKQLEKMEQISRCRFHHKKLCDDLISSEETLNCLTGVSKNLTNVNYKQLEAEKFYYQLDLKDKKSNCEQLIAQSIILKDEINLVCSKVMQINTKITESKKILQKFRQTIDKLLRAKILAHNKLAMKKKFIYTLEEISCNRNKNRIDVKLSEIRHEHEEWIRKIEIALRIISQADKNLNTLKTKLILQKQKNNTFKNIDNNQ